MLIASIVMFVLVVTYFIVRVEFRHRRWLRLVRLSTRELDLINDKFIRADGGVQRIRFQRWDDVDGNEICQVLGDVKDDFSFKLTSEVSSAGVRYYVEVHRPDAGPVLYSVMQGSHEMSDTLDGIFSKAIRMMEMIKSQNIGSEWQFSLNVDEIMGEGLN